jgi:hypothetical protein
MMREATSKLEDRNEHDEDEDPQPAEHPSFGQARFALYDHAYPIGKLHVICHLPSLSLSHPRGGLRPPTVDATHEDC